MKQITIIIAIILTSCGTRQTITVKEITEKSIITNTNDTILAKKRELYGINKGDVYRIFVKDGRCMAITKKIKF